RPDRPDRLRQVLRWPRHRDRPVRTGPAPGGAPPGWGRGDSEVSPGPHEPQDRSTRRQAVSTQQSWTEAACAELGLDPATVDERLILNLTRVVAHRVDRPAAPLTAFLAGLAAGRGGPPAAGGADLHA